MADLLRLADRSWGVLRPLFAAHAAIYRATGGKLGRRLPFMPPILLLDHVGARTGVRRTTPLIYMPDGDAFVVVAAKGGHPANPAWLYNLRAHPDTEVRLGAERIAVRAREAADRERDALWAAAAIYNRMWASYQRRTTRVIPIVVLERRPV